MFDVVVVGHQDADPPVGEVVRVLGLEQLAIRIAAYGDHLPLPQAIGLHGSTGAVGAIRRELPVGIPVGAIERMAIGVSLYNDRVFQGAEFVRDESEQAYGSGLKLRLAGIEEERRLLLDKLHAQAFIRHMHLNAVFQIVELWRVAQLLEDGIFHLLKLRLHLLGGTFASVLWEDRGRFTGFIVIIGA